MKPETFFDNFELIASAPNGVEKLRNLILQLAVQGKLVQKDDKDEPARILRENMKTEKERLIKEKKIKRTDSLSSVKKEEVPFDIPKHWEWLRIGDAMNLINGVAFKPSEWSTSGLPIIRIQNLNNHNAPFNYCNFDIDEKFHVQDSDFLISWSGTPGTSFGAFIWNRGHAILNQHIFRAELFGRAYRKDFLKHAINARLDEMIAKAHGGVGLQHITKGKLESLCIPLPPLAEQKRIVAKVDQLMSLCVELEARQQKKRESRTRLNSAALDRLLAARAPEEFAVGWGRISDNFDLLYDAPENVSALRQAILQLAVMGKLVAQDTNDEPASGLIKSIRRKNQIKTSYNPIEKYEMPYDLPKTWEWLRLGEILSFEYGDNLPKSKRNENGKYPVYGSNGIVGYHDIFLIDKPGIIVGRKGSCGALNICFEPFWPTDVSYYVIPPAEIDLNFAYILLKSLNLEKLGKGIKPGLNRNEAYQLVTSLPPLEEQRRIIARVDQLMSLCNKLEAGLMRSQADSERLMEAVVGRMLAG